MKYLSSIFATFLVAALLVLPTSASAETTETESEELKPGILYLHGGYLEGKKNRSHAKYNLNKIKKRLEKEGYIVRAPLRKNYRPSIGKASKAAKKQWKKLKNTEGVDPDRLYLVGFSRGGEIATNMLVTRKSSQKVKPHAAIIMASFPSEELSHKGGYERFQNNLEKADRITTPLVLMHAANDPHGDDVDLLADAVDVPTKIQYYPNATGHKWFYDHRKNWLKHVVKAVDCKKPYKKFCKQID